MTDKEMQAIYTKYLESMKRDGWQYQWESTAYRLTKAGCADRVIDIVMVDSGYAIREIKMLKPSELRGA